MRILTNHSNWANNEAKEKHPDKNPATASRSAQSDIAQTKVKT